MISGAGGLAGGRGGEGVRMGDETKSSKSSKSKCSLGWFYWETRLRLDDIDEKLVSIMDKSVEATTDGEWNSEKSSRSFCEVDEEEGIAKDMNCWVVFD